MLKCPNCLAILPDTFENGVCPSCGAAVTAPTSAKTVNLNDATLDSTFEEVSPDSSTTKDEKVDEQESKQEDGDEGEDSSKTVGFQGVTVAGTLDIEAGAASAKTKPEESLDESPRKHGTTSPTSASASDVTFDTELAKLGDSDATHAIGMITDHANISPMATVSFGTSGITVGSSATPAPVMKGTHVVGSKRTAGTSKTTGKTDGKTGQESADASIDFNRSVLSTISRRTLAEKAGPLSTPPDYEIVNKLGEGGMGVVYSAIQKTLDRKVAIKAIKAGKATSEESQRKFFYEAQITSDLDHPNIVPIHEMGSNDDGTLFYSMKMVDGTPWEDAILDKTRDENVEILMKVCDAVAFAHSRNIIHRDLKPENVMLGAFGEVLVMDWGLAVNLDTTQKFGMSGTPVYMAPEMAKHDLSKIGKASDIYILGGILFQIIVGKAPHKGKTVRECIANAIQNINIDPGMEDPLLDIANHAMATEPHDRYASVMEFQDAIRQHLRHSQSIALTHRAEELLQSSIRDRDYQGFSRALFSMQDAIELWPENKAAEHGLHRTRLAYGQSALDRSDYDLCLQIVDTRIEAEAALHALATERKKEIVQREKRFKLLRRILAAVILFAVVSLTFATLYARRQEALARESEKSERNARENESAAKQVAVAERDKAKLAQMEEAAAREKEETARRQAQDERDKAQLAQKNEMEAKNFEIIARKQAVASEQNAKASEQSAIKSEIKAKQAEQEAVRNARIAKLGKYQSELNLALNQTNQFDISRSNQLLQDIQTIEKSLTQITELPDSQQMTSGPTLQNWAFRRIAMLNNVDQASVHLDSPVTAFQIASKSKRAIVGTRRGRLNLMDLDDEKATLIPESTLDLRTPIQAVAISPDGEEAIIATGAQLSDYSVYRWNTKSSEGIPIRAMGKRNLQQLAISPNGQWAIGGINAGLWKWARNARGFESDPSLLEAKGSLLKLQFNSENEEEVFGLSKLPNGKSICIFANLKTGSVQSHEVPDSLADRVCSAALSFPKQKLFLGLDDGRLLMAQVGSANGNTLSVSVRRNTLTVEGEVQPKKHTTAVRGIEVHSDGTVLTFGEEPVIHVWKTESGSGNLSYASFLVGLNGNVTNAKFVNRSEDIVATDDLGNVMRWNVVDQDSRRMQSRSLESQLVAQTISPDGTHRSIDVDGVMRATRDNQTESFFIGHSPASKVTDFAIAFGRPLVATVAQLPKSSARVASEVCIWDHSTRTMIHRSQHETAGACRLAFVNKDEILVVGDGKETIAISLSADYRATKEKRFGTRLVVDHPTQPSISALIAPSGAVRIVDWNDPQKWDDLRYRNFDIAINNRFEPIEAAWSTDGKRLFVLFEQGRIARLEWDGATLSNLNWSDEMSNLRSVEQETPWRYVDFETKPTDDHRDQLFIQLRTSEAKTKPVRMRMIWDRGERKPEATLDQSDPTKEQKQVMDNRDVFDMARTRDGILMTVDGEGTLNISEPSVVLGRPKCLNASHSLDGKIWATLHERGCVLLANFNEGAVEWRQLRHDFDEVFQIEISHDGLRVAVVGQQTGLGTRQLYCFDISGHRPVEQVIYLAVTAVEFAKWHPTENKLVLLREDKKWHQMDEFGNKWDINSPAWTKLAQEPGFRFVEMNWLREPKEPPTGNEAEFVDYMSILSRSANTSRIDFIALNETLHRDFQPIISKAAITSFAAAPSENILAVGDAKGTLGIWFVSPRFDESPRELFTLPGHRGSKIGQVSFSSDGFTILSSDSGLKSLQWRSR